MSFTAGSNTAWVCQFASLRETAGQGGRFHDVHAIDKSTTSTTTVSPESRDGGGRRGGDAGVSGSESPGGRRPAVGAERQRRLRSAASRHPTSATASSRIALPEGFSYRSFSLAGTMMSDGNKVPLAHDGMGVFNMANGKFRLVRNHEDRNAPGAGIDGDRRGQVVRHSRAAAARRPSRSTRSRASSSATCSA